MSIPDWFILQAPPDLNIEIEHWKSLAWDRVKLLEQIPHNPSQAVRDHFPVYEEELSQVHETYRLGAYLLRLVAATNRRLEAWLIEAEGDLFKQLYFDRSENSDQRIAIFKTVFGSENVMTYEEFKYKMDEEQNQNLAELYEEFHSSRGQRTGDFLICVHFSQVPWMVSNRRGYLRKGWVISNEASFRGSLKRAFESKLQEAIIKAQELLGINERIDQAVQDIEQNLSKHAQIRSQFSAEDFAGRDLYSHPEIFPPCMIYLYFEFEKKGYLTHIHRLQLGFFLKRIGMTVEEQLQYWFEKSVDNVNLSFTEFQRTAGYQIRHLYGLEGGKKDYEVPKCSTIATSYFCPFVHLNPDTLVKFSKNNYLAQLKSRTLSEKQLEKIISQSANNPTQACTQYFQTIFGKYPYRKIVHPLQWSRFAIKHEGLFKEISDNESPNQSSERDNQ